MTTAKEARRAHFDTNATDYAAQVVVLPVHTIVDLDESFKPQDLIDALQDLARISARQLSRPFSQANRN
jgi:hypothetical protein